MPVAADMRSARAFLSTWSKPTLVCFSDSDPITRGANKDLAHLIPGARGFPEVTIKGAKHFLQDTHSEEICERIVEFLKKAK